MYVVSSTALPTHILQITHSIKYERMRALCKPYINVQLRVRLRYVMNPDACVWLLLLMDKDSSRQNQEGVLGEDFVLKGPPNPP